MADRIRMDQGVSGSELGYEADLGSGLTGGKKG